MMIALPYNNAFVIPFARVLLFLVKKLTVIGIIGNTHGVSNAAKPPKKPVMKMLHHALPAVNSSPLLSFFTP